MTGSPTRRAALGGVVTRRAALGGLGATLLAGPGRAAAAAPRVAALDWTLASACLSLGVVPAGVAERRSYARWVGEPALPGGVEELGRRSAPSLEGLAALAPDLILIDPFGEPMRPAFERIAPTLALPIYGTAEGPLAAAGAALGALGRRLGREGEAARAAAEAEAAFARARAALGPAPRPPVLAFNAVDARALRVFGAGSLFADVLERLGLASAWDGPTGPWGSGTVDATALARLPDAVPVLVEPVPQASLALLSGGLWAELTAGRAPVRLPAVWPFGELTAARRFADLLVAALVTPAAQAHAG